MESETITDVDLKHLLCLQSPSTDEEPEEINHDDLLRILEKSPRQRSTFLRRLIKELFPGDKLSVSSFERSFPLIKNFLCLVVNPETCQGLSFQNRRLLAVYTSLIGLSSASDETWTIFQSLVGSCWAKSADAWEILSQAFLEAIQTWGFPSTSGSKALSLLLGEDVQNVLGDFVFGTLDCIVQSDVPLNTLQTVEHSQFLAFCRLCSALEGSLQCPEENKKWCEASEDYFRGSLLLGKFTPQERIRVLELCFLVFPSYPFLLLEMLVIALQDPDYRMRKVCFEKLAGVLQETSFSRGENYHNSMSSKSLRLAARHTTKDPSSKVRSAALQILNMTGDSSLLQAKGVILSKLLDKDGAVRKGAKKILWESPLFSLLDEGDQCQAFEAILRFSSSKQDSKEAAAVFLELLDSQHKTPTTFLASMKIYQSPAFDEICQMLKEDIEEFWRKETRKGHQKGNESDNTEDDDPMDGRIG